MAARPHQALRPANMPLCPAQSRTTLTNLRFAKCPRLIMSDKNRRLALLEAVQRPKCLECVVIAGAP